jgi:hypothetical protein
MAYSAEQVHIYPPEQAQRNAPTYVFLPTETDRINDARYLVYLSFTNSQDNHLVIFTGTQDPESIEHGQLATYALKRLDPEKFTEFNIDEYDVSGGGIVSLSPFRWLRDSYDYEGTEESVVQNFLTWLQKRDFAV